MTSRLLALFLLASDMSAPAQTPPAGSGIILHRWGRGDGVSRGFISYTFRVPEAELRKTPAWEPSEGSPPLTRDAALKLARAALTDAEREEVRLDYPVITLDQPNPHDKRLGPVPADACRWFYTITFPEVNQRAKLDQFWAGGFDAIDLLVTMSGTVVRPSKEVVPR